MTREAVLKKLRPLCLALPGTAETLKWGADIVFEVNMKMFAVLGEWRGALCLTIKVGKPAMGVFLSDPRYFEAPYVGKHGWVALRLGEAPDWDEIAGLVRGSYELVSAKRPRSRSKRAER
jgi:predicted DNA-binding protein (MmcQ/YjbR family)